MSLSRRSLEVGVQARKLKRRKMASSARRTAAQGFEEPETSTTSLFARSKSRCVPETFSATSIAARTSANAPGPAEIGAGEAAAKRSRRPKAAKSCGSGRLRASNACTSHSKASSLRPLSRPCDRFWLATFRGLERWWRTCKGTSLSGDASMAAVLSLPPPPPPPSSRAALCFDVEAGAFDTAVAVGAGAWCCCAWCKGY
mmetsp:Transcript_76060/g.211403  ORF Transcript_76060/g.211403 Transcript_76060/m.211403 type:complete len:200 (+) Transcript_76060:1659-2258(+)